MDSFKSLKSEAMAVSNDNDCIMQKALIAISIDLNAKNVLDKSMQQLNKQVIQRKKDDILKLAN